MDIGCSDITASQIFQPKLQKLPVRAEKRFLNLTSRSAEWLLASELRGPVDLGCGPIDGADARRVDPIPFVLNGAGGVAAARGEDEGVARGEVEGEGAYCSIGG